MYHEYSFSVNYKCFSTVPTSSRDHGSLLFPHRTYQHFSEFHCFSFIYKHQTLSLLCWISTYLKIEGKDFFCKESACLGLCYLGNLSQFHLFQTFKAYTTGSYFSLSRTLTFTVVSCVLFKWQTIVIKFKINPCHNFLHFFFREMLKKPWVTVGLCGMAGKTLTQKINV